jgi:hypothetical protein
VVRAGRAAAVVTMLVSSHQLDLVEHLCTSVAIIHRGALVAHGRVADLSHSGQLKIAVKVSGDDQAQWTTGLAGLAVVERIAAGTATLSLAKADDAQAVLDVARRAGPVEQFGFERRRLSEVFRDAVGADAAAPPRGAMPRPSPQPPRPPRPARPPPHATPAPCHHWKQDRDRNWWALTSWSSSARSGPGAGQVVLTPGALPRAAAATPSPRCSRQPPRRGSASSRPGRADADGARRAGSRAPP